MRFLMILTTALLLAACGKKTDSSALACGSKSVFSHWSDNGGVSLDLSGLNFGTQSYQVDGCNALIESAGDQCSGTITVVSSQAIGVTSSTACADMVGVYDFSRDNSGLIYGKRGAVPIEYH